MGGFLFLAVLAVAGAQASEPACDRDHPDSLPLPDPNGGLGPEEPGDPGCPDGMARVEDFCIDRFEASLIETNGLRRSPYHNPGSRPARAVSVRGAVPQGYITQPQASSACAAAGKRLCTDVEWLRACRGSESRRYPYGTARDPKRCNDSRAVHPAIELFGDRRNPFLYIQNACLNQLRGGLARAGEYEGCATPEGVFDLMGNLHEWSADPAGTFRGGYYVDTRINGEGCLYRTVAHGVRHFDYSTGFRCCANARE